MVEGTQVDWNNSTTHSYLTQRNNMNSFLTVLTGLGFSNNLSVLIDPIIHIFVEATTKTIQEVQHSVTSLVKAGKTFSETAIKNFDYYFLNSVTGNLLTLVLTINSYSEDSKFLSDEQNIKLNEAGIHLMNLINSFGRSLDSFYTVGEEAS